MRLLLKICHIAHKVLLTAAFHHFLHGYDYTHAVLIQGLFAASRASAAVELFAAALAGAL